jgi:type I restriction enzyme M protein
VKRSEIKGKIYIPDFYDPLIVAEQRRLLSSGEFTMVRLGDFVESGELAISRGREIGSHFYGSGEIPFVRTSDIVNWEIKADPIKGVSEEVYSMFNRSIDVRPLDILFVNDGTFLIGRTAIVTEDNSKFLLQSHVRKLRCLGEELNPYYLMFLLNTKFVQSQIRANTFVQATISTLGNRVNDLMLPIHIDRTKRQEITKEMTEIIIGKNILTKRAKKLAGRDLL